MNSMGFLTKLAFRLFGEYSGKVLRLFPDLQLDLKKARLSYSPLEYTSIAILTSFIVFILEIPPLAFIYGIIFKNFLFSYVSAITTSIALSFLFFYLFLKYPKTIAKNREKRIDKSLPFALIHLFSISKSNLPFHRVLEIFSKTGKYKELSKEVESILRDINTFGLDIITALERASERSPSRKLREIWWGIISSVKSGGNVSDYLKERSVSMLNDYRRKIYEFSHNLATFIEIYLTAVILGVIFFIVLTTVMSGIAGGAQNIVILQFLLAVVALPLISVGFMVMIKASNPGEEE